MICLHDLLTAGRAQSPHPCADLPRLACQWCVLFMRGVRSANRMHHPFQTCLLPLLVAPLPAHNARLSCQSPLEAGLSRHTWSWTSWASGSARGPVPFCTRSSRSSARAIWQVKWPLTRRAISRFHFCPHDPRAHAALRSMNRYVHVRARLCLHARAVWHAAEHAHDLRRSTRATPCPVRAGRGFSS